MDQRVFGPYYSTPPEQQDQPTATQARFNQPLQTTDTETERPETRTSLRQRLLAGRRRKTRTTRP